MAVWDTSVASGLHPESSLYELASEAALADEPIRLAAPTVHEIGFGLQRRAEADARFATLLRWFTGLLDAGVVEALPLSWEAALLAGRLRAKQPTPPTGGHGSRKGRSRDPKPERRVAWIADIQIAATAWLAGEDVCTADRDHFVALSETIADLFPDEDRLQIHPPPQLDTASG
jgi:predicted nucleic acid-binding protein